MWFSLLILISFAFSLKVEIKTNFPLRKNNFSSIINEKNYKLITKALRKIPEFKKVYYEKKGNKIVVYIERYPIIKEISIKGNLYLRDYEIKNVLGLEENSPLLEANPKVLERILTDYYRELGFLNAKVKINLRIDKRGFVYVDIRVKEGELYFLGGVVFKGRRYLKKDELVGASRLVVGEVFNWDKVLNAEELIESYYRRKGFLQSFVFYKSVIRKKFNHPFKYAIFPEAKGILNRLSVGFKNLFSHPVATLKALVGKGKVGIPVYEIYEGERVGIKIRGNKHIPTEELLNFFDYSSVGVDIFSLEKYKERILKFYKKRGFFDASIKYELKGRRVILTVNEGKRYKAILRIGKEVYELPYDKDRIDKLIKKKIDYLKRLGYLDADYKYGEKILRSKKEVLISVKIYRGFRYILGSIKIRDDMFNDLNRELKFSLPTVLKESILSNVFETIDRRLKEKGYFDAKVKVRIKPLKIKNLLILNYDISIDRGERYTYGDTILYGYDKTRRREINYMLVKAKYFNKKNEEESVWNLIESGIFESVQFEDFLDRKNKKVYRVVNVKEKKRGVFNAFLGYSTYENIKYGAGITLRNLFGIGLINRTSFTKSNLYELYEVSFRDNFFFTRRLFTEFSLFNRYADREFYELFTRGGLYTLGYRLGRFASLALSLSRFRARTKGAEDGTLHLTKLSFFLRGKYITLSAGKSLSGRRYHTLELKARYGREIIKGLVGMRVKVSFGYVSHEAPIFERFFLGGFRYMKGYSYQSIGSPKGKRRYLYFSPEIYSLFRKNLELILFSEAGNAKNSFRRILKNLKYDMGLGVGLRTPVGLIRGELAYPLDKTKFTPSKLKFYLSVELGF